MHPALAVAFLLSLLASCTPEEAARTPAAPPADTAPATLSAPLIALDGEGLRLVDPRSGRTRLLGFGTEARVVEEALTRLLGTPRERTPLPDCGLEPPVALAWSRGLGILLADGEFVGWSAGRPREGADSAAPPLTSMAGLGVGSRREEIESAYALEVRETSLGTEFEAGGIFGILADAAAQAEVTALWAGRACIYR